MPHRRLRLAAWVLIGGWVSACGLNLPFARQKEAAPPEPDRLAPDLSPITPLLQMMSALPQGDPARQADIFQSAKDAADLGPTSCMRLRFALGLATRG